MLWQIMFYHTFHLYYVRSIDGKAIIIIIFIFLHGDPRSRKFLVSGSIFMDLPPYAEKKPSQYCNFLLLPMVGVEPGPLAQQASALPMTHIASRHLTADIMQDKTLLLLPKRVGSFL